MLELVRALAIAWKNLAAYPPGHPALVASLGLAHRRLQDLLAASGAVTFGISSDGLVAAQEKLTSSHARDLARALYLREVALLLAYLLLSVNIALAACSRGTFKISYGPFGGTELRILLALANTVVWLWPQVVVGGRAVMAFDVMGGLALLGLVAALVRSTVQNTCALYALERL